MGGIVDCAVVAELHVEGQEIAVSSGDCGELRRGNAGDEVGGRPCGRWWNAHALRRSGLGSGLRWIAVGEIERGPLGKRWNDLVLKRCSPGDGSEWGCAEAIADLIFEWRENVAVLIWLTGVRHGRQSIGLSQAAAAATVELVVGRYGIVPFLIWLSDS
jgi:hypothetical protein